MVVVLLFCVIYNTFGNFYIYNIWSSQKSQLFFFGFWFQVSLTSEDLRSKVNKKTSAVVVPQKKNKKTIILLNSLTYKETTSFDT